MQVLHSLYNFPKRFIEYYHSPDACITCDDGDLEAWEFEGQRWARLIFIVMTKEHHMEFIFKFLRNYGVNICKQRNHLEWLPLKFLILNSSLVQELRIIQMKSVDSSLKGRSNMESLLDTSDHSSVIFDRFTASFLYILEEIVSYAKLVCSTFWCNPIVDSHLPSSIRGKLGGPSQRRLASRTTTAVMEAILSMQTIASLSSWCAKFKSDGSLDFMFTFLWSFAQKVILSPKSDFDSETGSEISLAAYEALVPVLKAVASTITPANFDLVMVTDKSLLPKGDDRHWLDNLILSFLQNINELLCHGKLARSRRAILMNWKWLCLNSLLEIQHCMIKNAGQLGRETIFLSTASMKCIYSDLIESLENANENSVLPMLRSVRLVLGLFASGGLIGFDDVLTEVGFNLLLI
ncbi:tRNA/rRNA methyltransferase (SpoU) family protein [Thalictrum thalictroides]|uniref:tRNA/rRNA methyltransferase (SpoU) family protein n=1 Tax=Thalictrum thalictroides TaxID=46969 RepID=A0A7J6VUC8_THATH|nr:tRNA/rRNA methyltransferase (SpoU) family protein [Thalictrum thalictroides]